MAQGHRRTYVTMSLLVALVLAAAAAVACSAQATTGSGPLSTGSSAATSAGPGSATGAEAASSSDWSRVLAALAYMRADSPTKPVVVLLGGSAARESTIDDESWRSQIVDKGGPATLAWNMGSGNRTMAQNVAVVKKLPKGADVVVLIGINLGAFTSSQKTASITLPTPAPTSVDLKQPHSYGVDKTGILSTTRKKLNAPTTKFRSRCAALHKKYDVPWIPLLTSRIPSTSFYDLWHLVEPGRIVWQKLLSAKTAALLKQYHFDGGGS